MTAETKHTKPKRKYLVSLLLIVVMLGGGSGLAGWLYSVRVEPPRRDIGQMAPLVESVVVKCEDVTEQFVGYGTVLADRVANLSAEVSSTVVERPGGIDSGSIVSNGQLLIRLDDREYRHVLDRALALTEVEKASLTELSVEANKLAQMVKTVQRELDVALDEKKRVEDLFERDLAAQKEYNIAVTAYQRARLTLQSYEREEAKIAPRITRLEASRRSLEASTKLARLHLERCQVRAPFSGTIQHLFVDEGDHVAPGVLILTLMDSSHVEIPIQFPAAVYDRVNISAPCRMECESTPHAVWTGEVSRISPDVDEQTRTFSAYVHVDNTHQSQPLVPGTFVRAVVIGPTYSDRVLVPRGAIRKNRVYVVQNGVVHERNVTAERFILDRAMIRGDLSGGETVILSHLEDLSEGSAVRVAPSGIRQKASP